MIGQTLHRYQLGAMVLYIGCQSISNLLGQWQHRFASSLARDTNHAFLPIHIAEPKSNSRPHAIPDVQVKEESLGSGFRVGLLDRLSL